MSDVKKKNTLAKIIHSVFVGTYISSGLFVLIGFGFAIIISGAGLMGAAEAPSTIHITMRIGHHGAIATVIAQLGIYLACALGAKFPKVRKVWAGLGAILTAVILIAFLSDEISLLN
ncbi:MAG: hypothetical protein COB36_07535 [Alphaproteobacteria bacterium]|nr:MAG: hypothetical protein COB36_07535 [Alphaproteobacteria bacterium]